jgi:hypothetical protein
MVAEAVAGRDVRRPAAERPGVGAVLLARAQVWSSRRTLTVASEPTDAVP